MQRRCRTGWTHPLVVSSRLLALALILVPSAVQALEAFGGRVQAHGYYEMQLRAISRNFSTSDDLDLSQWYHVFNLETEFEILEDTWGPFDLVVGYARVEARYDCVWTRGCGMFPSWNTFGDRSRKLPKRLGDGRRAGFTGGQFTGDTRRRLKINREDLSFEQRGIPPGQRNSGHIWNVPGIDGLFGGEGPDGVFHTADDPGPATFRRFDDYHFAQRKVRGSVGGVGTQVLGPWRPQNNIRPIAALADIPNPFNPLDFNPILSQSNLMVIPGVGTRFQPLNAAGVPIDFTFPNAAPRSATVLSNPTVRCSAPLVAGAVAANCFGRGAMPFRPAPTRSNTSGAPAHLAQGLYYPNAGVARAIRKGHMDAYDQNFRQAELAWNHGASQQQTKELKEAYLDILMLEARLWLRVGRQSIVWGKTELFRTTDQFNPQDLALSSLPSLEESRVSLWAARAVYSFYQVGPFEDVRLELAVNLDHFEPADTGRCGEPYTVNVACNRTAGLFAHGISGLGLAGETRPPDPLEDVSGVEFGARLEFRWDRFSFVLSDFYGYDDLPYLDQLFRYERNVDPQTGRLRETNSRLPCDPTGIYTGGDARGCLDASRALTHHHANQQIFALACAATVGFSQGADPTACSTNIFNSGLLAETGNATNNILSLILGGIPFSRGVAFAVLSSFLTAPGNALAGGQDIPLVSLGLSAAGAPPCPNFLPGAGCDGTGLPTPIFLGGTYTDAFFFTNGALSLYLSQEQQALLGCGPLLGTNCDTDGGPTGLAGIPIPGGIDLMNADASALSAAWTSLPHLPQGFDHTRFGQPGTLGDAQARYHCLQREGGQTRITAGCRRPGEPGYSPAVDGVPAGIAFDPALTGNTLTYTCPATGAPGWCLTGHPFTGEAWRSEIEAVSFNLEMALVMLSAASADEDPNNLGLPIFDVDEFDPNRPLRTDGCSFAVPHLCNAVQAIVGAIGRRRPDRRAGGNGTYGRGDFIWHGGTAGRLKYEKRNVLGFGMDFAEDVTKSSWSLEFAWVEGLPVTDNNELDGIASVDTLNLSISVDRPTFINFLNAGRTVFFNSQIFLQWTEGFRQSMPRNGPFQALATLTAFTAYYQDRLMFGVTGVYDFNSRSAALLPQVSYRYSENFSVEFGVALFSGRWESTRQAITPIALGNQVGDGAYREFSERGLAIIRDRDEVFLRFRKTF